MPLLYFLLIRNLQIVRQAVKKNLRKRYKGAKVLNIWEYNDPKNRYKANAALQFCLFGRLTTH